MSKDPGFTPRDEVPPAIQKLCDRIHAVAEQLPTLVFVPNADHSRLYPLVVVADDAPANAREIKAYLQGKKLSPPTALLRDRQDLTLEAIHGAADYLPTIVFLPAEDGLHPVNLVPETVSEHLKPCYRAVQQAQKSAIGLMPIAVSSFHPEAQTDPL